MFELHQRPLWYTEPIETSRSTWKIVPVGNTRALLTIAGTTYALTKPEDFFEHGLETDFQVNRLVSAGVLEIVEEPVFYLESKHTGKRVPQGFMSYREADSVMSWLDHPSNRNKLGGKYHVDNV